MGANNDYFASLEKVANELLLEENPEPMLEDPSPEVSPEEVEALQAEGSPPTSATVEEQMPASPDHTHDLEEAVQAAEEEYLAAQEQLANVLESYESFIQKTAQSSLIEPLPQMGALAKLIEYSSNPDLDSSLHKVAKERLQAAFSNDDEFHNVLSKTANELFSDPQNLKDLYSEQGMSYVADKLESYVDEELSKEAFEAGSVVGKVVDTIKDYGSAAKNFWKLRKELTLAKQETDIALQKSNEAYQALQGASPEKYNELSQHYRSTAKDYMDAKGLSDDTAGQVIKGGAVLGTGAPLAAGGAIYGGKKLYDATHPQEEDEIKVANQNNLYELSKGGNTNMTVVKDFLKIAGAAGLINVANDESMNGEIRKEAADTFNTIARMSRQEMDDSFVKIATSLFTEDQLHEIVAGHHTEELLDKVAFFLDAYQASAEDLEKVAGADGVAAKGVGGALTDAKKNIEEHIKEDKTDTENGPAGQTTGSVKAQDTSGYNVTNNPEKYDVDKTAMLEQAFLQKQAAIQAFNEAEEYIRSVVR